MRKLSTLLLRGLYILLAVTSIWSRAVCAGDEEVSWGRAQNDVNVVLMQSGTNLATLVQQVCRSTPANGEAAMFKLNVLTRAGMDKESIRTLNKIKMLCPEFDNSQVSAIYGDACDEPPQSWALAQAAVEIFADKISELNLEDRLIEHFLSSGWPVERVDGWLASQPKGIKNFWARERLHFNMQRGRGEALALEKEFAERVRANPEDTAGAIAFLDAIIYARAGRQYAPTDKKGPPDFAWIAETIKPKLATDACEVASRLAKLRDLKSAGVFFRQAIAIPLTDKEIRTMANTYQTFISETLLRARFEASVREKLAECLLKSGQIDEAQKWILEAREKNHLETDAQLAGRVEAAGGEQVVQEQIKAEEKISETDPQYWRKRAEFFRGRNDPAEEEEALKKGFALTKAQPEPARMGKRSGTPDWRASLLSDYAHFLVREKRKDEALAMLHKEIAESPASGSASRAVDMLLFDYPFKTEKQPSPDDKVMWAWLDNQAKWENREERLLGQMLGNANKEDFDKYFTRAEKLVFGGDPSRAYSLGCIENHMRFPQRSLTLLKYATGKTQDDRLKEEATYTLFGVCLDAGDWKGADAVFPNVCRRLGSYKRMADTYSNVAVIAAKEGAKADAMRIWRRVANLNLLQTDGLDELVQAGLKNELIAFYLDIQKAIPASDIPAKMLEILRTHYGGKSDGGAAK